MNNFKSFISDSFDMAAPFVSLPTDQMGSDIMQTKLNGMSNVLDILKNRKTITQSICLLASNIVLDMIENALELEPQTISDQLMEVLRLQVQDAIQRTNFNK